MQGNAVLADNNNYENTMLSKENFQKLKQVEGTV